MAEKKIPNILMKYRIIRPKESNVPVSEDSDLDPSDIQSITVNTDHQKIKSTESVAPKSNDSGLGASESSKEEFQPQIEECFTIVHLSLFDMMKRFPEDRYTRSIFRVGSQNYKNQYILYKTMERYGLNGVMEVIPDAFYQTLVLHGVPFDHVMELKGDVAVLQKTLTDSRIHETRGVQSGRTLGTSNAPSGKTLEPDNVPSGRTLGTDNVQSGRTHGSDNVQSGRTLGTYNVQSGRTHGPDTVQSGKTLATRNMQSFGIQGRKTLVRQGSLSTGEGCGEKHSETPSVSLSFSPHTSQILPTVCRGVSIKQEPIDAQEVESIRRAFNINKTVLAKEATDVKDKNDAVKSRNKAVSDFIEIKVEKDPLDKEFDAATKVQTLPKGTVNPPCATDITNLPKGIINPTFSTDIPSSAKSIFNPACSADVPSSSAGNINPGCATDIPSIPKSVVNSGCVSPSQNIFETKAKIAASAVARIEPKTVTSQSSALLLTEMTRCYLCEGRGKKLKLWDHILSMHKPEYIAKYYQDPAQSVFQMLQVFKKYRCTHCGNHSCQTLEELQAHEEEVHMRGMACYFCGLSLKTYGEGLSHFILSHSLSYTCTQCKHYIEFPDIDDFIQHTVSKGHEWMDPKILRWCIFCGMRFSDVADCMWHIKHRVCGNCQFIGSIVSERQCPVCKCIFFDEEALQFHCSKNANMPDLAPIRQYAILKRRFNESVLKESGEKLKKMIITCDMKRQRTRIVLIKGLQFEYDPQIFSCTLTDLPLALAGVLVDETMVQISMDTPDLLHDLDRTQNILKQIVGRCSEMPRFHALLEYFEKKPKECLYHRKVQQNIGRPKLEGIVSGLYNIAKEHADKIDRNFIIHDMNGSRPSFLKVLNSPWLIQCDGGPSTLSIVPIKTPVPKEATVAPEKNTGNTIIINNQQGGTNSIILGGPVNQIFMRGPANMSSSSSQSCSSCPIGQIFMPSPADVTSSSADKVPIQKEEAALSLPSRSDKVLALQSVTVTATQNSLAGSSNTVTTPSLLPTQFVVLPQSNSLQQGIQNVGTTPALFLNNLARQHTAQGQAVLNNLAGQQTAQGQAVLNNTQSAPAGNIPTVFGNIPTMATQQIVMQNHFVPFGQYTNVMQSTHIPQFFISGSGIVQNFPQTFPVIGSAGTQINAQQSQVNIGISTQAEIMQNVKDENAKPTQNVITNATQSEMTKTTQAVKGQDLVPSSCISETAVSLLKDDPQQLQAVIANSTQAQVTMTTQAGKNANSTQAEITNTAQAQGIASATSVKEAKKSKPLLDNLKTFCESRIAKSCKTQPTVQIPTGVPGVLFAGDLQKLSTTSVGSSGTTNKPMVILTDNPGSLQSVQTPFSTTSQISFTSSIGQPPVLSVLSSNTTSVTTAFAIPPSNQTSSTFKPSAAATSQPISVNPGTSVPGFSAVGCNSVARFPVLLPSQIRSTDKVVNPSLPPRGASNSSIRIPILYVPINNDKTAPNTVSNTAPPVKTQVINLFQDLQACQTVKEQARKDTMVETSAKADPKEDIRQANARTVTSDEISKNSQMKENLEEPTGRKSYDSLQNVSANVPIKAKMQRRGRRNIEDDPLEEHDVMVSDFGMSLRRRKSVPVYTEDDVQDDIDSLPDSEFSAEEELMDTDSNPCKTGSIIDETSEELDPYSNGIKIEADTDSDATIEGDVDPDYAEACVGFGNEIRGVQTDCSTSASTERNVETKTMFLHQPNTESVAENNNKLAESATKSTTSTVNCNEPVKKLLSQVLKKRKSVEGKSPVEEIQKNKRIIVVGSKHPKLPIRSAWNPISVEDLVRLSEMEKSNQVLSQNSEHSKANIPEEAISESQTTTFEDIEYEVKENDSHSEGSENDSDSDGSENEETENDKLKVCVLSSEAKIEEDASLSTNITDIKSSMDRQGQNVDQALFQKFALRKCCVKLKLSKKAEELAGKLQGYQPHAKQSKVLDAKNKREIEIGGVEFLEDRKVSDNTDEVGSVVAEPGTSMYVKMKDPKIQHGRTMNTLSPEMPQASLVKRGRGRPPKKHEDSAVEKIDREIHDRVPKTSLMKRGRGRPPKNKENRAKKITYPKLQHNRTMKMKSPQKPQTTLIKRGRGRPPKKRFSFIRRRSGCPRKVHVDNASKTDQTSLNLHGAEKSTNLEDPPEIFTYEGEHETDATDVDNEKCSVSNENPVGKLPIPRLPYIPKKTKKTEKTKKLRHRASLLTKNFVLTDLPSGKCPIPRMPQMSQSVKKKRCIGQLSENQYPRMKFRPVLPREVHVECFGKTDTVASFTYGAEKSNTFEKSSENSSSEDSHKKVLQDVHKEKRPVSSKILSRGKKLAQSSTSSEIIAYYSQMQSNNWKTQSGFEMIKQPQAQTVSADNIQTVAKGNLTVKTESGTRSPSIEQATDRQISCPVQIKQEPVSPDQQLTDEESIPAEMAAPQSEIRNDNPENQEESMEGTVDVNVEDTDTDKQDSSSNDLQIVRVKRKYTKRKKRKKGEKWTFNEYLGQSSSRILPSGPVSVSQSTMLNLQVQPGMAFSNQIQPGMVFSNQVQPGLVMANQVQPGIVITSQGMMLSNQVQSGFVLPNQVQLGIVSSSQTQPNTTQPQIQPKPGMVMSNQVRGLTSTQAQTNTTQPLIQPKMEFPSQAQPGVVFSNQVQQGMVLSNQIQQGIGMSNLVQPGIVMSNQIQPGMMMSNLVQPGFMIPNQIQPGMVMANQIQPGAMMSNQVQQETMLTNPILTGISMSNQVQPGFVISNQLQPGMMMTNQAQPLMFVSSSAQAGMVGANSSQPGTTVSSTAQSPIVMSTSSLPGKISSPVTGQPVKTSTHPS